MCFSDGPGGGTRLDDRTYDWGWDGQQAFLGFVAVVPFAVFGTGVFVGMQVGGGVPADSGATETGPQATDVPTTDSPASGSEPTPSPDEEPCR